jgi:hypothetical protein
MAPDSRRLNPYALAAAKHAKNLDEKATRQMIIVYPQVTPLLSRPKLVFRPESVKYYGVYVHKYLPMSGYDTKLTMGRSRMVTRSSIFSTNEIANPLSCGMMSPARKPPAYSHVSQGKSQRNFQKLKTLPKIA